MADSVKRDSVQFKFSFYPEAAYDDEDGTEVKPYETVAFYVNPRPEQIVNQPFVRWYLSMVIRRSQEHLRKRVEHINRYEWFNPKNNTTYDINYMFTRGGSYKIDIILEDKDDVPLEETASEPVPAPKATPAAAAAAAEPTPVPVPIAAASDDLQTGRNHLRAIVLEAKSDSAGVVERILTACAASELSGDYSRELLKIVGTEEPSPKLVARLLSV